jgi:hypothetical protein
VSGLLRKLKLAGFFGLTTFGLYGTVGEPKSDAPRLEGMPMPQRIAITWLFLTSAMSSADAAKLDQSYITPVQPLLYSSVGNLGNGEKADQAQTFRVGLDGRLAQVDLYLNGYGDGSGLLLKARRTTPSGLPSDAPSDLVGAALSFAKGTASLEFVPFNFGSLAPQVHVGEELALVLTVPGSGLYEWGGAPGNPYPLGQLYTRSAYYNNQWSPPNINYGPADLGFRTYVEPVPEPTACTVFVICGLVLIVRRASCMAHLPGPFVR